jgi:hypothetical protein
VGTQAGHVVLLVGGATSLWPTGGERLFSGALSTEVLASPSPLHIRLSEFLTLHIYNHPYHCINEQLIDFDGYEFDV